MLPLASWEQASVTLPVSRIMSGACAEPDRLPRLAKVECAFFGMRDASPDLSAATWSALGGIAERATTACAHRIQTAAACLIEAVDKSVIAAELPYHNRHHIAEVVLTFGWLAAEAVRTGRATRDDAALATVAMVGHDLLHDGSPPGDGVMERNSANAVCALLNGCALSDRDMAIIHAVIIGTNPTLVPENAARAEGDLPEGALGRSVDGLIAMANEADVFASMLPNLGAHLTELLIDERRRAGFPEAADLGGDAKRLGFLSVYARATPSAQALGIEMLCQRQAKSLRRHLHGEALDYGADWPFATGRRAPRVS